MEKRFKETYPDGTDMWELTTDELIAAAAAKNITFTSI